MKLYDITIPISNGMPVWPGDPAVSMAMTKSILSGDKCNVTRIRMGSHTGTHVDSPYHFFKDKATIDMIPLETLIGPCLVVESCANHTIIKKEDFKNYDLRGHSRILIKTKNSQFWANNRAFNKDYSALRMDAAQYLAEMNFKLVGIDYLSIEPFDSEGSGVHKLLLANNIPILEGLNLSDVEAGPYELVCLPLKLKGCDGAPARAILRQL